MRFSGSKRKISVKRLIEKEMKIDTRMKKRQINKRIRSMASVSNGRSCLHQTGLRFESKT